ncbi:MAG: acetyl-CoA carboxylase biotin carboxyl carrier protein subunit [Sciscionella sp.]
MAETIQADMNARVWKILVAPSDRIEEATQVMILESMKMEIPIIAETAGIVVKLLVSEGDNVTPGQPLVDVAAG